MTMYRAIIIVALGVLASVLPSGPSFVSAQTEGVMPFSSAGFQSGVIDEVQGSTIRIDGRSYVLKSAVEVGLIRVGRLRQSVLRSAFEGRL